jgi:hypothetical protein
MFLWIFDSVNCIEWVLGMSFILYFHACSHHLIYIMSYSVVLCLSI